MGKDKVYIVYEGEVDEPVIAENLSAFSRKSLARKYQEFVVRRDGYRPEIIDVPVDPTWKDTAKHRFFTVGLNWNPNEFGEPDLQKMRPPRDLDTIQVFFRGEPMDPWSYREQYDAGLASNEGYLHDGQVSFMQRPSARHQRPIFSISATSKVSYEEARRLIHAAWEDRFYDEVMKSYDMYDARKTVT
jgi:hypothetical protein